MKPQRIVAGFDSATAMLRALSSYNAGEDVPLVGEAPGALEGTVAAMAGIADKAPRKLKEKTHAAAGWSEAVPMDRVREIDSDELAAWVTKHYPHKQADVAFAGPPTRP